MKILSRSEVILLVLVLLGATFGCSGCDDAPTAAVVENTYPTTAAADGGSGAEVSTVFKVWWVTTLFPSPLGPGQISDVERTVPGEDFAYAVLAPGWSPDRGGAPPRLIALKSRQRLTATAHQRLTIAVSDDTFSGNCFAESTLGAEDARVVVERIFPGQFAGMTYDPATCTMKLQPSDAATD